MLRNFIPLNKVIRTLIFADFIFYSAWGFIGPIIAIYFIGTIEGADTQVVGIAAGVFMILRSILQVPIGKYLDRNHGEHDDYWFVVIGALIASFVPLFYIFITQPWHLYLVQAIYAVGMAMAIPAWGGIFMRHIDKNKEAQSWGLESSAIGLGAGITGIIGGTIASVVGFTPLFIAASLFGAVSVIALLYIKNDIINEPVAAVRLKHPKKFHF